MLRFICTSSAKCLIAALLLMPQVRQALAEDVSFKDKRIEMIIGYAAGGGTDAAGRLIAQFLGKYLPGSPTIVARNMPGADEIGRAHV